MVVAGALAFGASACDVSPTAATVNGVGISQRQFTSDLAAIAGDGSGQVSGAACMLALQGSTVPSPTNGAGEGTVTQAVAGYQLNNLILGELVHQHLARLGRAVTKADLAAARADLLTQLTPSGGQGSSPCGLTGAALLAKVPSGFLDRQVNYLAEQEKLAAVVGGVDLSEAGLRAYYQAHPDEFQLICLSDIAVPTQAQAAQIRQAVAAGTLTFEAAAAQSSQDTQTRGQGGQIGCFPTAQIQNQVILGALNGVSIGDMSQPVNQPNAQAGAAGVWLLLKVDDKPVTPFAEARSQIRQELLASHNSAVTAAFVALTRTADVVVNPQYGSWGRIAGVRPPGTPPPGDLLAPLANRPASSVPAALGG
jgi:hypothetical protein